MKDTLEYRILKFLKENDNGEYLTIEHLSNNKELLNTKISTFLKLKYISEIATPSFNKEYIEYTNPRYKIEFEGLKYFDSLKPPPIPKDRKIYLVLFIIFGCTTFFFAYKNYESNNRNDKLDLKVDTLNHESQIYKDSVKLLKSQIKLYNQQSLVDSLKTQKSRKLY